MTPPDPRSDVRHPPGKSGAAFAPHVARNVRIGLVAFVVAILLLVFAVPRSAPPPASLAHPNEAFVDRAGIVSTTFANQWAGGLLNDDRAQIVVYVDRAPPEGEIASWAIRTASDWKIGASKEDTGMVLWVFTEPRIARIDVGYGLEDKLTDARVRQLLEAHLAPAFAAGEYEAGFDALLHAVRKEIGGYDMDSIHARSAEARKRDDVPWLTQLATLLPRTPRVLASIVTTYLEEDSEARIAILIAASIGIVIAAFGIAAALNTLRRLSTLPAAWRARGNAEPGTPSLGTVAFESAMGVGVCIACLLLLTIVLLAADSYFTREGRFSGAGAMIVWPQ